MNHFLLITVLAFVAKVTAECPNACSGYGTCNAYDTCTCDARHMGNDCSQRVCPMGNAHSDVAKGDLNGDGTVTNPDKIIGFNGERYRYGTTEGYPNTRDSEDAIIANSAHYDSECSSKGFCDRSTGSCVCFPAYDGAACQRASCPGYPDSCSGHGVCKTIKQLAYADFMNVYELWDEDSTMGCECDSGYYGADCSLRKCKSGVDPLYEDDVSQRKTNEYYVGLFSQEIDDADGLKDVNQVFNDGTTSFGLGTYQFVFVDTFGKEWYTGNIGENADCITVVNAFMNIPQDTLPVGAVRCTHMHLDNANITALGNYTDLRTGLGGTEETFADPLNGNLLSFSMKGSAFLRNVVSADIQAFTRYINTNQVDGNADMDWSDQISGDVYALSITSNGRTAPISIRTYLDGNNPTYVAGSLRSTAGADVKTVIFSDGKLAETNDYFGDFCAGVAIRIGEKDYSNTAGGSITRLLLDSAEQEAKLKACLGDSDGYPSNNIGLANWDKGSKHFPHMIKITKVAKNGDDDSDYLVLSFNGTGTDNAAARADTAKGEFLLHHPYSPRDRHETADFDGDKDRQSNNYYHVHTTQSTLKLSSIYSQIITNPGDNMIYTVNASYDQATFPDSAGNDQGNAFSGDLSCENSESSAFLVSDTATSQYTPDANKPAENWEPMTGGATFETCVEKGDLLVLLGAYTNTFPYNPQYVNFYSTKRVNQADGYTSNDIAIGSNLQRKQWSNAAADKVNRLADNKAANSTSTFMLNSITLDNAVNFWRTGPSDNILESTRAVNVYKFHPHTGSTYEVFAECSNRGICDTDSGICKCFSGYEGDACSVQSISSC